MHRQSMGVVQRGCGPHRPLHSTANVARKSMHCLEAPKLAELVAFEFRGAEALSVEYPSTCLANTLLLKRQSSSFWVLKREEFRKLDWRRSKWENCQKCGNRRGNVFPKGSDCAKGVAYEWTRNEIFFLDPVRDHQSFMFTLLCRLKRK